MTWWRRLRILALLVSAAATCASRVEAAEGQAPPRRLTLRAEAPRAAAVTYRNRQEEVAPVSPDLALPACKPLADIGVDVLLPAGELPTDLSARHFEPMAYPGCIGRPWAEFSYAWEASGLFHLPLYFEDVALERYGHTICPVAQSAISAAYFFGELPLLPYLVGLEPPLEHVHALGYYRPGNPTPWLFYMPPFRADAAAMEAGAITGLIFLIP